MWDLFYNVYIYQPLLTRRVRHHVNFKADIRESFLYNNPVGIARLNNLNCHSILPIATGKIVGVMPFIIVLLLFFSRIWTRVTVFISEDNNHHTTNTWLKSQKCPTFLPLATRKIVWVIPFPRVLLLWTRVNDIHYTTRTSTTRWATWMY